MRTVPLVVRSDSGRVLARIEVPKLNGQKTFVKIARKLDDRRSFWMTESVVKGLQGYRVVVVSDGGVRQQTFPQPRSWCMSADFDRDPVAAISRVMFIRQMDANHLAVMIAHPIKAWRSVTVSSSDMRNDRDRYESLIAIADTRRGVLVGSATAAGFPVPLLPSRRAAVYRESEDGTPRVAIIRYSEEEKPQ